MTTRSYEALIIFKTAGTEQEIARCGAQLEELIKKLGGTVDHLQSMGRRKLAFRIARHVEGYYYLLRFHLPTEQVEELERLLRLQETIVRFMIISTDDIPAAPAVTRAVPAAAHATASRGV